MENKFNYKELNKEFQALLEKHENDSYFVLSSDEEHWSEIFKDYPEEDKELFMQDHATFCNAWQELCANHEGLQDVADWSFGASAFKAYDNPWDLFVEEKELIYD